MSTDLQNCVTGFGAFMEPPKPNHGPHGDGEWLMSRGSGEVRWADLLQTLARHGGRQGGWFRTG